MVIFMLRTRVTLYYPAADVEPGDLSSGSVSWGPGDGITISGQGTTFRVRFRNYSF